MHLITMHPIYGTLLRLVTGPDISRQAEAKPVQAELGRARQKLLCWAPGAESASGGRVAGDVMAGGPGSAKALAG